MQVRGEGRRVRSLNVRRDEICEVLSTGIGGQV